MPRVLVLGGGFGGAYTARRLGKLLRPGEAEITLVSKENYLFFTPFATEIVGGSMEVRHATAPLREVLAGCASFVEATVESIDLEKKTVATSAGPLPYDVLVVAIGSVTNWFGNEDLARHAFSVRSLPDSIAFRNRVIDAMEEGGRMPKSPERTGRLTFAVVGAGPTGVELATDLADFVEDSLVRQYPEIAPLEVNIKLIEGGRTVLPAMDPRLAHLAEKRMRSKGVDVMLERRVKSYNGRQIEFSDGKTLRADTLAWTAGLAPHPVVAGLTVPKDRTGRIRVDEFLRVERANGVFALGDCASCDQDGAVLPPEGQVALQQARAAAGNIAASLRGQLLRPFRFRRYGRLVSLGRRYAVSEFFGLRFWGFLGWWLWRTVYLFRLPGVRNKVRVMLDWTLDLFFPRETVRIRYTPDRPKESPFKEAPTAPPPPPPDGAWLIADDKPREERKPV